MIKLLIATAYLVIVATAARADVAIIGIGSRTCAVFAQDYKVNPNVEASYFLWRKDI